ncbi:MAG: 3-deoxy-manno-octulosonate cytidylyltransferase [Bacteriovoracaceae bacterium]
MCQRVLVLIPARYQSSRFPGKPLAEVSSKNWQNPKTLIQLVCENVHALVSENFDYAVVTDSDEIEKHLSELNYKVVRVDDDVRTGSERIYLAYERNFKNQKWDLIVNLQGDEPLFDPEVLERFIKFSFEKPFEVTTMVNKRTDETLKNDRNIVKAVFEKDSSECHYFSRAPIPYGSDEWFQHVGIYGYRNDSLTRFFKAPASSLEIAESLEQLRALGLGLRIGAMNTERTFIGVDTPEDIKKLENYYNE